MLATSRLGGDVKAEVTRKKVLALVYAIGVVLLAAVLSSATNSAEVFYLVWGVGFLGALVPAARWASNKLKKD
jgi:uncharacterized membrane protein